MECRKKAEEKRIRDDAAREKQEGIQGQWRRSWSSPEEMKLWDAAQKSCCIAIRDSRWGRIQRNVECKGSHLNVHQEQYVKLSRWQIKKLDVWVCTGNLEKKYGFLEANHCGSRWGVTLSYTCPHCNIFPLEVSTAKKHCNWWCAICGERHE